MRVWVATIEPDHNNSTVIAVAVTSDLAKQAVEKDVGKPLEWDTNNPGSGLWFEAMPDRYGPCYAVQSYDLIEGPVP